MALPSQSGQPARRRIHIDRRPRRARRTMLVAAVGVLVVLGTVRLAMVDRDGDAGGPVVGGAVAAAGVLDRGEPIQTPAPRPRETARRPARAAQAPGTGPPAAPIQIGETAQAAGQAEPATVTVAPPTPAPIAEQVAAGLALAQGNRPVAARRVLTQVLRSGRLNPVDAEFVRETLRSLNRRLVLGPQIVADDPFVRVHVVGPGEQLGGIVRDRSLDVDWRFILRINNMPSPRHLRAGQQLKLITGPFHAVVDKSDFRMDLYLGSGDAAAYVTSLPVGLGVHDSTPLGLFRVRAGSKLENPSWANPRTGQRFDRDDPANPIGEYWIGLKGIDDATRDMIGYGIHGTIDPDSIGRQASMGCMRLLPDDVRLVFEMLTTASTVEIRP